VTGLSNPEQYFAVIHGVISMCSPDEMLFNFIRGYKLLANDILTPDEIEKHFIRATHVHCNQV